VIHGYLRRRLDDQIAAELASETERNASPLRLNAQDESSWGTEWGTVPHGVQPISAESDLLKSAST
jgi:hypothetical protein